MQRIADLKMDIFLLELMQFTTFLNAGCFNVAAENMAEVLGSVASGITLAALFKLGIEAFDLIQTFHNQALDLQKLTLRLNIEKCRLYTWGEAMGLTAPADNGRRPLESFDFKTLVQETLELLLRLFSDTSTVAEKFPLRSHRWRHLAL
jgi:hypothetical protein